MLEYTHNPILVLLSICVAIIGCLLGLAMVWQNKRAAQPSTASLGLGAIVIGGTIFSMHFIAMTAVTTTILLTFDIVITIVSLAAACVGTFAGLAIAARKSLAKLSIPAGGLVMGCGIAAMHYVGMSGVANCTPAYTLNGVLFSVGLGVAASIVALTITFTKRGAFETLFAAVILGGAICSFHYAAMASTSLFEGREAFIVSVGILTQDVLGYIVAGLFLTVSFLFFGRMAEGV